MTFKPFAKYVFILGVLAAVATVSACQKAEPTAEEKRASATRSMGGLASVAASLHVDAMRTCKIAGVEDIERCAQVEGMLLPEREAKAVASVSLGRTKTFFERCTAEFSLEYCNDLIARAIEMEWRKPVGEQPGVADER